MICLSGHGGNAMGIVNFVTEDGRINLSEIISAINSPSLLSIGVFVDTCRSCGREYDELDASRLINTIIDKRIAIVTAGARGSTVGGGISGGKLIKSICEVINLMKDQFIGSFESMGIMLRFIVNVSIVKIKQHVDFDEWKERIYNEASRSTKEYQDICTQLPSIYLNKKTRVLVSERNLEREYQGLFRFLCKQYEENVAVSKAAHRVIPTNIKK